MDPLYENPRPRITTEQMGCFTGAAVTMIGVVEDGSISSSGDSLVLATKSKEQGKVQVTFASPLNELVENLVEVTGTVMGNGSIRCDAYKMLPSGEQNPFDLDTYNEVLNLRQQHINAGLD